MPRASSHFFQPESPFMDIVRLFLVMTWLSVPCGQSCVMMDIEGGEAGGAAGGLTSGVDDKKLEICGLFPYFGVSHKGDWNFCTCIVNMTSRLWLFDRYFGTELEKAWIWLVKRSQRCACGSFWIRAIFPDFSRFLPISLVIHSAINILGHSLFRISVQIAHRTISSRVWNAFQLEFVIKSKFNRNIDFDPFCLANFARSLLSRTMYNKKCSPSEFIRRWMLHYHPLSKQWTSLC